MIVWVFIAILSGTALAVQAGCNSVLSRAVGGPITAALVSFCCGTLALSALFFSPLVRQSHASLTHLPWWAWGGGVLGAIFVAGSAAAAPRLGAAGMVAVILAAQLCAAVIMDHFALVGFSSRPVTVSRFLGVLLLLAGTFFIRRS